MALIPVGIHNNLVISEKSKINDKGSLELVIKSVESPEAILAALENNEVYQAMESNFRFFTPSITDYNKIPKSAADIVKDLTVRRHQLSVFAELFGTKEEVAKAIGNMAMFEGLGIPPETYGKAIGQLTDEDFLKKVDINLCTKFLNFLKAKNAFNKNDAAFRAKCPRGSKNKIFSSLSKSTYDVWLEPMSIPQLASKIEWSDYEIDQGLNHSNPIASDATQAAVTDVNKANALFKKPDAHAESDTKEVDKMAEEAPTKKPDLFKAKK
jgi:hypothetical protein